MGTSYPAQIVTDLHVSEALIATATDGVDLSVISPTLVIALCVRNWALGAGVTESIALAVARTERPATPYILNRLMYHPKIEAALPSVMSPPKYSIDDEAIAEDGVGELQWTIHRLEEEKRELKRRVKRLERDLARNRTRDFF